MARRNIFPHVEKTADTTPYALVPVFPLPEPLPLDFASFGATVVQRPLGFKVVRTKAMGAALRFTPDQDFTPVRPVVNCSSYPLITTQSLGPVAWKTESKAVRSRLLKREDSIQLLTTYWMGRDCHRVWPPKVRLLACAYASRSSNIHANAHEREANQTGQ